MEHFVNDLKCFDCQHCFKKSPLFNLLDDDELELLNCDRMEAKYKAGEIIYKQGTPLSHLVIIHEGFGKIYIEGKIKSISINCKIIPTFWKTKFY